MILIIEIGCGFLIFRICREVSYSVDFILGTMYNFNEITEISLEYHSLIIKIEIELIVFKILSILLLQINFFFTLIELL